MSGAPQTSDISPWTPAEQHGADCALEVQGEMLHIPRALLTMCSPVVRALGASEGGDGAEFVEIIPVLGFEVPHVCAFLECIHPGMFVETTARVIIEAAPVAHYFQAFALLEQFVKWLAQYNEEVDVPAEAMDAIVLLERLRVRTPGHCPWTQKLLLEVVEARLVVDRGAGAAADAFDGTPCDAYDYDLWSTLKPETQVMILDSTRCGVSPGWGPEKIVTKSGERLELLLWLREAGFTIGKDPLLYSATRDGFEAATFHRLCDDKGGTLTLIRSGAHLFGGFLDISWKSTEDYQSSSKAFLFALRGPAVSTPTKFAVKETAKAHAARFHATYGPMFGGGSDLYVCGDANTTRSSRGNLGHTYAHPTSGDGVNGFFTGNECFTVDELEVFRVEPL